MQLGAYNLLIDVKITGSKMWQDLMRIYSVKTRTDFG